MVANPVASNTATCPTCHGTGEQIIELEKRALRRRCLACRRTGRVDASRVCLNCGKWRDMCFCPNNAPPLLEIVLRHPEAVIEVTQPGIEESPAADPEPLPPASIKQNLIPTCPFALAGCRRRQPASGFYQCPRCGFATLVESVEDSA